MGGKGGCLRSGMRGIIVMTKKQRRVGRSRPLTEECVRPTKTSHRQLHKARKYTAYTQTPRAEKKCPNRGMSIANSSRGGDLPIPS